MNQALVRTLYSSVQKNNEMANRNRQFFCHLGIYKSYIYQGLNRVLLDSNNGSKFLLVDISHITRKPVFGVSDQVRLKPACSVREAS